MLESFFANINKNSLFGKKDFLLLAISGGVDSVVLADLLYQCKFPFAMAHCNFALRGKEADKDEQFILELSQKYSVPFYSIKFDTNKYAKRHGLSIQIAARQLRYNWFRELMKIHKFSYLLTAHHLDDVIETIFLNQLRGTGINGLTGIPLKSHSIVRPLLPFTKQEILQYAKDNHLSYREDCSNQEDKYQRNYLRHYIIPEFQKLQPQLHSVIQKNIQNLEEARIFIHQQVNQILQSAKKEEKGFFKLDLKQLKSTTHLHFVLHHYLSQFKFNESQIEDIVQHLNQSSFQAGKQFFSDSHTLLLDRDYLFIFQNNLKITPYKHNYIAKNIFELQLYSNQFHFDIIENNHILPIKSLSTTYLNADLLKFPLILRQRKNGDIFQLLGTFYIKKLSDILIDKKVPLFLKDKIILLCNSNGDIVWIGHLNLVNEKYKVTPNTRNILKITTCE